MWKVSACLLLLLNVTFQTVNGNGYYGGGGGWKDGSGSAPQAQPHSANSQITSYPQYESPSSNTQQQQDYWWLKNNPFQKPANHPGVEKGDEVNPSVSSQSSSGSGAYGGQTPFNARPRPQQQAQPSYGGQSQYNPGAYSQQQQPQQQHHQQQQQYNSQPAQPQNPYGPSPQPTQQNRPQASPECLLRNQADCHAAASLSNANQGNPNYQQQQQFSGYPSDDSNTQNSENSGNYPNSIPTPQSQRPQPQQNDYSNKVAYQPPSIPYQEPTRQPSGSYRNPVGQSQNNAQSYQAPPQGAGSNYNGEEQPPYPGCPAAMLCVPETFCNSKGVSEGKPVSLSAAEKLYRVALMVMLYNRNNHNISFTANAKYDTAYKH